MYKYIVVNSITGDVYRDDVYLGVLLTEKEAIGLASQMSDEWIVGEVTLLPTLTRPVTNV